MLFFSQNLKYLREKKGLKQSDTPDAIGFSQTAWNNYEKGRSKPKVDDLLEISKYFEVGLDDLLFKDLSAAYLMEKPKGKVFAHPNANLSAHLKGKKEEDYEVFADEGMPIKKETHFMPRVVTIDSRGDENAVLVPVRARAGYLLGYGDPNFVEKLPAYRLPGLNNGTFRIFETEGVSMFPTLQDKDKVISRWTPVSEISNDRVYVLVTKDHGLLIKRVLNRLADGKLICKSDNNHKAEYPNIVLDIYEVLEAWYVVERWTRQLPGPGEIYKRIVDLEADMAIIKQKLLKGS